MKIEKITENKIRIILNIDELTEENIDFLSLTKNTNQTQKLFKKILKKAEKEVNFYVQDCRLLIEAFISSEGFFIVTFTKITAENDVPVGVPAKIKVKKKTTTSTMSNAIYEFNNFSDFSEFCTYLDNYNIGNLNNLAKKTALYEYERKYFLIFFNLNSDFKNAALFFALISEFARLSSDSLVFISKLSEYGKSIFKNDAINYGIKYFKNPA